MIKKEIKIDAFNITHGLIKEIYNLNKYRTKYTKNEIRVYEDGYCEIDVYDAFGEYKDTSTFSEIDPPMILPYKWYKDNTGYLCTTIDKKKVRFHKHIFPTQITDHYDSNKLNNRRENLQQVTQSINIAKIKNKQKNRSGITGLYQTKNNTWCAYIEVNKMKKNKNFKEKEEAVLMRYIWELNNLGINAPQIDDIKAKYPRLYNGMINGYKISENVKLVIAILNKLDDSPFCPCKIEKSPDTKCMCKEFLEQKSGACHCGLYIKVEDTNDKRN